MQNSKNVLQKDIFGQELILNLYDCDGSIISDAEKIKQFAKELCDDVIKMKRFGDPLISHFGHDNPITSGYTLVQLIETSSVTAHFSEQKRSVYLNIFSCAWFDAKKTTDYCKNYFKATRVTSRLIKRQ